MENDLRRWMTLLETRIDEALLPANFEHSDWGYWIEPDGTMRPVNRHSHYLMYKTGFEAYASGRIRVTSISDPSKVKTDTGMAVFAANFFTPFVTKKALYAMVSLIENYDFDVYTISGMSYDSKEAFASSSSNGGADAHCDKRSIADNKSKTAALRCVRAFIKDARDEAPLMFDATPEKPFWEKKTKPARAFGRR